MNLDGHLVFPFFISLKCIKKSKAVVFAYTVSRNTSTPYRMNRIVIPFLFLFHSLYLAGQTLVPFISTDQKMGYKTSAGKIVIQPKFEKAFAFTEGLGLVSLENKYGFINVQGVFVIQPAYDFAESFSGGLAAVGKGTITAASWGYIDKTGKEKVPLTYKSAGSFREGRGLVQQADGLFGYIDVAGKVVIPFVYLEAGTFSEGLAWAFKGKEEMSGGLIKRKIRTGKFGYVNLAGKEVIPFVFDKVMDFSKGKAKVEKEGRSFWINKEGQEITENGKLITAGPVDPRKSKTVKNLSPVIRAYKEFGDEGPYGLYNSADELIVPHRYSYAIGGSNGIGAARDNNTWYIFNNRGEQTGSFESDIQPDFSEGLSAFKRDGRYGYVDTTGKTVISNTYANAYTFRNGLARVTDGSSYMFIDRSGKKVICCYDFLENFFSGWAKAGNRERFGGYFSYNYINKLGDSLLYVNHPYKDVYPFFNGYAILLEKKYSRSSYSVIDSTGKSHSLGEFGDIVDFGNDNQLIAVARYDNNINNYKWGYVDLMGRERIPMKYNKAENFRNGYALVETGNDMKGLIDTTGRMIITPERFTSITNYQDVVKISVTKKNFNPAIKGQYVDSIFVFNKRTLTLTPDSAHYANLDMIARLKAKKPVNTGNPVTATGVTNQPPPSPKPAPTPAPPPAPVNKKLLTGSFTKYYNYKRESYALDKLVEENYKVEVNTDYIRIYIQGTGSSFVFWKEYKIVASDNYEGNGLRGQAYLSSGDQQLLFSRKEGKDYLLIQPKSKSSFTEYLAR